MYAEIVIPKTGFKSFTYKITDTFINDIKIGMPVLVSIQQRYAVGVVINISKKCEIDKSRLKNIVGLIDPEFALSDNQFALVKWISEYYISPLGDVMKAAFPPGFLGRTKTRVMAGGRIPQNSKDRFVYDKIQSQSEGYPYSPNKQIIRGVANSLIKGMISRGELYLSPDYKAQQPRQITYVYLDEGIEPAVVIKELTARKRQLLEYIISHPEGISIAKLVTEGFSRGLIKKMAEDGILRHEQKAHDVIIQPSPDGVFNSYELTDHQKAALGAVETSLNQNSGRTFLIHGVTGSGKTLVYIKAARKALSQGKSVLLLLPEISLTPQAIDRFTSSLNEPIALWHSRITIGQRHEIYKKVHQGEIKVVLGVRSAVFSPLRNLGLIVIDEEQDDSYKQSEPPPYYNARDVALMRAKIEKATTVLGSATPSLESYYNAEKGKYELLRLPERYGGAKLPKAMAIDLKEVDIDRNIWPLSEPFIEKVCTHIADGKQVIILLNRRGYSGLLMCQACGYVSLCPECRVTLTYHKYDKSLHCHFCGYTERAPNECPDCGGNDFDYRGIGTQKLEEMLIEILGEKGIIRMDSDSTAKKGALEKIITTFEIGERPVLVGTRMVAKGHHFPKVGMVGVVLADAGLHLPDFRASEKVFQLLVQAAGRAGRTGNSDGQGEFVVQSYDPSSGILDYATSQNYEVFYYRELAFRKELGYPPYGKIIRLVFSHEDHSLTKWAARQAAGTLRRELLSGKVLGPATTGVFRLRNKYHFQLLLKGRFSADFKNRLRAHIDEGHFGLKKGVTVKVDVDPREMV